jgi:hypothetical protein
MIVTSPLTPLQPVTVTLPAFFWLERGRKRRGANTPLKRPLWLLVIYFIPSFFSTLAIMSRVVSIISGLTDIEVMPHSTSFSVISG